MDRGANHVSSNWFSPDILSEFIDELREAGYNIGISQYIAAQDLILALAAQGESLDQPERLRTLLGPIVCHSPAEQEDFQHRFNHWIKSIGRTKLALEKTKPALKKEDVKAQVLLNELEKIRRRSHQLKQILILVLVSIVVIGLPIFLQQPKETPVTPEISAKPETPVTSEIPAKPETPVTPEIPAKPETPVARQAKRFNWSSAFMFCLLTFSGAFLAWRLWWLWRARLFLQRLSTTNQPELQTISIHELEQNLLPALPFIHTAQSLRKRVYLPSNQLDLTKTIEATICQGGWLTPVYGTHKVFPEYLFLINRASYNDHQTKFIEEMIDRLVNNGVFITKYFFDDDPRICFPANEIDRPQKLHEIAAKYPQHRLIINADAEKLFSTQTGALQPWVNQIMTWNERAILNPKPVETWGYQELKLVQYFIVLPATPKGIEVLSQVFYQGSATYTLSEKTPVSFPESLRIRTHIWIDRNPPPSEQVNSMLDSLDKYLGKEGFYWFSACAVFPKLQWNITIYLGNVLETVKGKSLLEVCSVTKMIRLPWFRYGYMPDWLRNRLITKLTQGQEKIIRSVFQDLLLIAVQGHVGKLQLEVARQSHSSFPRLANRILRLLSRRSSEDSLLREHIFLSFMTKQPKLAVEVPNEFSRLVKEPKTRRWLSAFGTAILIAFSLSLFSAINYYQPMVWHQRDGNAEDVNPQLRGSVYNLGGGGLDVDRAIQWMIDQVRGCEECETTVDLALLRFLSDIDQENWDIDEEQPDLQKDYLGYHEFLTDPTIKLQGLNSIQTFVFSNPTSEFAYPSDIVKAIKTFVFKVSTLKFANQIEKAEVIFFAPGDQCKLVRNFNRTGIKSSIESVQARGGAIGGNSAGAMIHGEWIFDSCLGTIYSDDALANPYDNNIVLTKNLFQWPELKGTIIDTHFYQRDRMGRAMTFVARLLRDGITARALAIGIDESTSLVIDQQGIAQVMSNEEDGSVYFILGDHQPEICEPDTPLSFSDYKIWRVRNGETFNLQNIPATGYYLVSVDQGRIFPANPYQSK